MPYTLAPIWIHTEVRSDVVEIVFQEFQHIPQDTASSPSRLIVVTKNCGWLVISGWCIPAPVPEWLPPPSEEHLGLNKAPFSPSDRFSGLAGRCVMPVARERRTRIKKDICSAPQRLGRSPAQWFPGVAVGKVRHPMENSETKRERPAPIQPDPGHHILYDCSHRILAGKG